jgi:anti-sigma factor RsiW
MSRDDHEPARRPDCDRAQARFSDRHDGTLAQHDSLALEAHLARCAECRVGFVEFERALEALERARPAAADRVLVDSVMAAIDRAPLEAPASRRFAFGKVGSHLLTGALSAAAALLVAAALPGISGTAATPGTSGPPLPGGAPSSATAIAPPAAPAATAAPSRPPESTARSLPVQLVSLAAKTGASRSGNREAGDPVERFELRRGERYTTPPSQAVELELAEDGTLHLRVEAPPTPPRPELRVVRVRDVRPLLAVDRELVDDAAKRFGSVVAEPVRRLDSSLDASARAVRDAFQTFVELDRRVAASASEPAEPPAIPGAMPPAAPTAPVTIRRDGGALSLAVRGTLIETVPELIELLASGDAEVADLAAARLETLRASLESDPRLAGRLAPLPPSREAIVATGLLARWLGGPLLPGREETREVPRRERWRRWWQENAGLVLAADRAVLS